MIFVIKMKLIKRKKIKQVYKMYEKEIEKYWHFYCAKCTTKDAKKIIRLIQKKFKIKVNKVDFNWKSKDFGGMAFENGNLKFNDNGCLSLFIVCHECNHLICYKKKIYYHKKGFYKNLDKVIKYIEQKIEFKIK